MANWTDNQLIQVFLPIINDALIADGFLDVIVKQSAQPTAQGIPTAPMVFFSKIGNTRFGFLKREDVWDTLTSSFIHYERQYFETTFQVSALALQDPKDTTKPTASDLINEVASIMQSDSTRDILNASGIGILRIRDVTNSYFIDDHDNFEASPTFDFTLVYLNTRSSTSPNITPPVTAKLYGV